MVRYMAAPRAAIVLALLILGVGVFLWYGPQTVNGRYSEAASIAEGVPTFKELSERFEKLAEEKGGVYAYEVLKRAPLPPNTDLHLLGHVVGDVLYKQEGVSGIANCTQDFRNACSHSIVVGALNDFGESALSQIREACKKAPGGSGAYTMCYHGLGHGVFAFFEYDLGKTVEMCGKTGTKEHNDREYIECVGGSVMELMGGGGHDREAWLASRERYLDDDPLAPCSSSVIPDEVKAICYTYISPQLFERAGANLAMPEDEHIAQAFLYCDRIQKDKPEWREACFSGIGKELPLLAVARDTRAITTAGNRELTQMRTWCALAPHEEAYRSCTHSIQDSLFWGGENDPRVSVEFCSLVEGDERSDCFEYLSTIASFYVPRQKTTREAFCMQLPQDAVSVCTEKLAL